MAARPPSAATQVTGAWRGHLGAPAAAIDPRGAAGVRPQGGSPRPAAPQHPSAPMGAGCLATTPGCTGTHTPQHLSGGLGGHSHPPCSDAVCVSAHSHSRSLPPGSDAVPVLTHTHTRARAAAGLCVPSHPALTPGVCALCTPCSQPVPVRSHSHTHSRSPCSTTRALVHTQRGPIPLPACSSPPAWGDEAPLHPQFYASVSPRGVLGHKAKLPPPPIPSRHCSRATPCLSFPCRTSTGTTGVASPSE